MDDINIGQKILNYRKSKGLTIRELAERSNITPSLLSQIERSLANPSINTLKNVAKALEAPLFTFFIGEDDISSQIVRSDQRKRLIFPESQALSYELLSPDTNGAIEFLLLKIPPKEATSEALTSHDGEEVLFIIEGAIDLFLGEDLVELGTGDSVRIMPFAEHRLYNPHEFEAKVVFAVTPPRF